MQISFSIDLAVMFVATALLTLPLLVILTVIGRYFRSPALIAAEGFVSIFGRTAVIPGCALIIVHFAESVWMRLPIESDDIVPIFGTALGLLAVLLILVQSAMLIGTFVYANVYGERQIADRLAEAK